jgi:CIC family chloride channel protein
MHLVKKVEMVPQDMTFLAFKNYFPETKQRYFPVMDEDKRMVGVFSSTDIRGVLYSKSIEHLVVMSDIATSNIIFTTPSEDLNEVLKKFTLKNIDGLPVVQEDDHHILIGMLYRREVISFYNKRIEEMKNNKNR